MKYEVYHNAGMRQVVIARPGYEPNDGGTLAGMFELGVDAQNQQTDGETLSAPGGDHPLVNEAKRVLRDNEELRLTDQAIERMVFMDRASNAPAYDESATATDDLPVDRGVGDPNASSQAGGEVETDGTEPSETDPNGVSEKHERTDEGGTTPSGDGPGTSGNAETVEQLKTRIAGITNHAELQAEYDKEQAGSNRTTAIKAIEDRAKELAGDE